MPSSSVYASNNILKTNFKCTRKCISLLTGLLSNSIRPLVDYTRIIDVCPPYRKVKFDKRAGYFKSTFHPALLNSPTPKLTLPITLPLILHPSHSCFSSPPHLPPTPLPIAFPSPGIYLAINSPTYLPYLSPLPISPTYLPYLSLIQCPYPCKSLSHHSPPHLIPPPFHFIPSSYLSSALHLFPILLCPFYPPQCYLLTSRFPCNSFNASLSCTLPLPLLLYPLRLSPQSTSIPVSFHTASIAV